MVPRRLFLPFPHVPSSNASGHCPPHRKHPYSPISSYRPTSLVSLPLLASRRRRPRLYAGLRIAYLSLFCVAAKVFIKTLEPYLNRLKSSPQVSHEHPQDENTLSDFPQAYLVTCDPSLASCRLSAVTPPQLAPEEAHPGHSPYSLLPETLNRFRCALFCPVSSISYPHFTGPSRVPSRRRKRAGAQCF